MFFTVVQIGLNAVAILGGIVGDAAFSPAFHSLFSAICRQNSLSNASFIFFLVSDWHVYPVCGFNPETHRYDCARSGGFAYHQPDALLPYVCTPLVWFFNGLANMIFRIFKLPMVRKDDITSDDIYAVVEAGALAGVLRKQEHELNRKRL